MRTKQTGKSSVSTATASSGDTTSSVNNVASATPKHMKEDAPAEMKSPAPPADLSDADREKLKTFLDRQDRAEKPFSVVTQPSSRKRKRAKLDYVLQEDLWEDRLAVRYEVKPRDKWESLRRYKKFTGKSGVVD